MRGAAGLGFNSVPRSALAVGVVLFLTVSYSVLQIGFVRPYLPSDASRNLARPPAAAAEAPDALPRVAGAVPRLSCRQDRMAEHPLRVGSNARRGDPADSRLHRCGDRPVLPAQQRRDRRARGAGTGIERGRRGWAAARCGGCDCRARARADPVRMDRCSGGISDRRARDPVLPIEVTAAGAVSSVARGTDRDCGAAADSSARHRALSLWAGRRGRHGTVGCCASRAFSIPHSPPRSR